MSEHVPVRSQSEKLARYGVLLTVLACAGMGLVNMVRNEDPLSATRGVDLTVSSLNSDVEARYLANMLTVRTEPGQAGTGMDTTYCTGERIGSKIVTAAHCTRYLYSDSVDEKTLDRRLPNGKQVPAITTVSGQSGKSTVANERWYPQFENGLFAWDVVTFDVPHKALPSLQFTYKKPKLGDGVYMYSRFGEPNAQTYGGRIIKLPNKEKNTLLVMYREQDPTIDVCAAGTSGTAVIDEKGDVVGINVAATETSDITVEMASVTGLAVDEIGRIAQVCTVVPATTVRPLL